MKYLVCLLEEPSAEEMLKGVLPHILPKDIFPKYVVFDGKQDLEKHVEKRLKHWLLPDSVFLVMRDKDLGNCICIKENLLNKVIASGKQKSTIIRIACHELESFYLGDLAAVEFGMLQNGLSKQQNKSKYRTPDNIAYPADELLRVPLKITN